MIREALDHFQITPHLTANVMREISRIKPVTPSSSKPLIPWVVTASTLAVVLLMLGFGNSKYSMRFQKPYSLDANAEMTVEIVDAPIVANLESKPNVRTEKEVSNAQRKIDNLEQQPNDASAEIAETQAEEVAEDYTKWELPKAAKARLGKGGTNALAFSPDGSLLAVGSNIGIWLYNAKTGKEVSMFPGACESLAFSPDGTRLAIANQQLIHFTDVRTGRELARLREPNNVSAMAVSPDGKTLAIGSSRGIRLWNTETGKIVNMSLNIPPKDMFGHTISTLIFSRDGKKLVSADSQGNVQIWDTKTGDALTNFLTGDEIEEPMDNGIEEMIQNQFLNRINAFAFSTDDALLAVGKLGQIRLFGSQKKARFKEVSKVNCNALVFSPDDTVLVVGLWDGGIQLLDIATGDELATLDGHTALISKLLFSSDGKTLFSTGYDGTILVWDWDEVLNKD